MTRRKKKRSRWRTPLAALLFRLMRSRHFQWVAGTALGLLCLINLSVSFFGNTVVFPLSPRFLGDKVRALGSYARHRPSCLGREHLSLEPLIAEAERRHGLPRGLLLATLEVESGLTVHRISGAGAMGPGQIMPSTARALGLDDPFDPAPAVDASARYLAAQLRRFHSSRLALAAYNAGPGAVGSEVPHNGETEFYVAKVMAAYQRFAPRAYRK